MFEKVKEKIKKDKLKSATIIIAIMLFLVGLIVTIANTSNTYATSLSDYSCSTTGWEPVYDFDSTDSTDNIACCPSGYDYIYSSTSTGDLESEIGWCVKTTNGNLSFAEEECAPYDIFEGSPNLCFVEAQKASYRYTDCKAGYYYTGQGSCSVCPAGYYCLGGTFLSSDSSIDGINTCPVGTTSVSGSDSLSDCVPDPYTVTLNPGAGVVSPTSISVVYGSLYGTLPTPTRTGYTFAGWYLESSFTTEVTSSTVVSKTSNHTLYAKWEEITDDGNDEVDSYKVTFNANGGEISTTNITVTYGKEYGTLPTPTRTGYTFAGWYLESSFTTEVTSSTVVSKTSNHTLYAKWKVNEYEIKYELNGGIITANPSSAKYDEEITIKYPTKSLIVYFNDNKTDAVISDKTISVDFKFRGWTSNDIDFSTAYYGTTSWTKNDTLVTDTVFKNLASTDGATVTLVANWEDSSITLPNVTKEGYTCGWNTSADGKGDSYQFGDEYTVSYDSKSVNLYAMCTLSSKTDDDVENSPQTGTALIYLVWVIGVGALGYSVYYYMSRKNSI